MESKSIETEKYSKHEADEENYITQIINVKDETS